MYDRADNWQNSRSKFGGTSDPMTSTSFQHRARLARGTLDDLFRLDWITRAAVERPANDATRKWIKFLPRDGNEEQRKTMDKEFKRLGVRNAFRAAMIEARLYGGSVIVMGAFDGKEPNTPLELDKIRFVMFVNEIDRFLANPLTFVTDPEEPNFGKPEIYLVTQAEIGGSRTSDVHATRVIRFDGEFLPKLERLTNFGWGDSVVDKMLEPLKRYGVAMQSGAATLQDFVTSVLKIDNLRTLLASGGFAKVQKRLAQAAATRSTHNMIVVGGDEEVTKMGTPITQMPKLIEVFQTEVSASSGVPRSVLFHAEGGKLAGDGGSSQDLNNYYDDVHSMQETRMRPQLDDVIEIIGAPFGITLEDVPYEFVPLQEMTEKEQAEIRKSHAEADQIYVNMGAVDPDEITVSRFSDVGNALGEIMVDQDRRREFRDNPAPDGTGDDDNDDDTDEDDE